MTPNERLGEAIRERMNELGLTTAAWKRASGISDPLLRELRDGVRAASVAKERAAERALLWAPRSFDAIRRGGQPVELESTGIRVDIHESDKRTMERVVNPPPIAASGSDGPMSDDVRSLLAGLIAKIDRVETKMDEILNQTKETDK